MLSVSRALTVLVIAHNDGQTLLATVDRVYRALTITIEEIVLVTLAHVIFLMHFRSILIVTLPLPLAVLMSFLGMYYAGISSNIMSLAGIAIAIGVLVDAGIVVTENAFRFVEQRGVDPGDRGRIRETVRDSTRLVGRPVFFSMAIILLAFIPVFALTGQEGKLFHPLAFTKTFAVLAATVIAVTLVPVCFGIAYLAGLRCAPSTGLCCRARSRIGPSQSRRPWFSLSERWSWRVGSEANSCRRSMRAT